MFSLVSSLCCYSLICFGSLELPTPVKLQAAQCRLCDKCCAVQCLLGVALGRLVTKLMDFL